MHESTRLYEGADWDFPMLERTLTACTEIAEGELGLSLYPNELTVITSDQMLEAYSAVGMPLMYSHWSFGKRYAHEEALYRSGQMGLAYEIVINSSPCISFLMEENTATMMTLVIAHAACGHNHFFRNNSTFKEWTNAAGIHNYLAFAKKYVAECEERYGYEAVERTLDAAHALMSHGVHRHHGKRGPTDLATEEKRERERKEEALRTYNDLWRTVPQGPLKSQKDMSDERRRALLGLPSENLLYFLEKSAPRLHTWQRELLRIVRQIAQYFYPQMQTKMMNEGTATYTHYRILERLYEKGLVSDGNMGEFLHSHTNVITQLPFNHPGYHGFNPYALGFAMMQDIEGIVTGLDERGNLRSSEQRAEDKRWFPDIAGTGDAMGVLRDAWAHYRDENFIRQFLSPRLMRKMSMFHLHDNPAEKRGYLIRSIHDEEGYRDVRRSLAQMYDIGNQTPDIEVVDVDLQGDRKLIVRHTIKDGRLLQGDMATSVAGHLADLWGYEVVLEESDPGGHMRKVHAGKPREPRLAGNDRTH